MTAKIIRLRAIEGIIYADSLDVANDFGREHKNIIRDFDEVRRNIGSDLSRSWFREQYYHDRYGRQQRCILMTEEGWQLVVMNIRGMYDWKVAYILKFKEMREKLGAGAHADMLFDRAKCDNVVEFPQALIPQGELPFDAAPEAALPIVDPAREEAELEAELQRFNEEFGYETELPKGLVVVDQKLRQALLKDWRERHHNQPNQLHWENWDDSPQVCYGRDGRLFERYDESQLCRGPGDVLVESYAHILDRKDEKSE